MAASTRQLRFNTSKMDERFSNHLREFKNRYSPSFSRKMQEASELGLIPQTQKEVEAHIEKLQKLHLRPVDTALLSLPHPTRVLDFGGTIDGMLAVTSDASIEVLSSAYNPNMSLTDVEMFCLSFSSNPYLVQDYPEFSKNVQEYGAGSIFTTLAPMLHYLRSDPIFTFTSETCAEARSIDISKGIDTSYLRAPVPNSYFHLERSGLEVHDSQTGYHELDGFYLIEAENHCYDFEQTTLDALGLDGSKPYRAMQIIFTGKPKDTALNDTMIKIDIFLQDGMPIDEMIERTLFWYSGKVQVKDEQSIHLGGLENKTIDTSNLDVAHNVKLVRDAINFIAYLSFADFRKQESNKLKEGVNQVMSKAAKNRKKAAKKLRGLSNEIIIQTKNSVFAGGSKGSGYKVSAHIRRGFIRNQQYGSGDNIHHKPKFIAPTVVAQSDDSDSVQAKNYRIK